MSIGVGAVANALFLLAGLLRAGVYRPRPGWWAFGLQVLLACIALGAFLAWAGAAIDWIDLRSQATLRAGWMALVLPAAAALYFAVLAACGLRLRQFVRRG